MNTEEIKIIQRYPSLLSFPVYIEGKKVLEVTVWVNTKTEAYAELTQQRDKNSRTILQRSVAFATNTILAQTAVRTVSVCTEESALAVALKENAYRKDREVFTKTVDPFRYLVPQSAFDGEGYLINQGLLKAIPYGAFNSDTKGCGWIATYNFLKANSKETSMAEVSRVLGRQLLREAMGENIFRIAAYLKHMGFSVGLTFGKKNCIAQMKHSKNGILLYGRTFGAHFVFYRREFGHARLHFYNAVYGKENHYERPEEFFSKYQRGLKAILIFLK